MLDKKVADLLNGQVNEEFFSAYLYLEMSNYFNDRGLDGFAHWFRAQAEEEKSHAMKIICYLQQESMKVELRLIAQPELNCACISDVLMEALSHEESVTSRIHNIYGEASRLRDYRTMEFLDWFVREQAEEEDQARHLVVQHQLFSGDVSGLYLLDQELAKR